MSNQADMNKLGSLLKDIQPPQQDYENLARTLAEKPFDDPICEILRQYFLLFANGYVFWQQSYDYPRIQDYFWIAYMTIAKELQDDHYSDLAAKETLRDMLRNLSVALIENTNCESSLASNIPQWLAEGAEKAESAMMAALADLDQLQDLGLESVVYAPLHSYLMMNLKLYRALRACARLYLTPWHNTAHADITQALATAEEQLRLLQPDSRELFSELRAHVGFARRNSVGFEQRGRTSLRVKQANITLRATGYLGVDLVAALYAYFESGDGKTKLLKKLREETGIDFSDARHGYLNETFETNAGITIMSPIVLEFPAGADGIVFTLPDGDRVVEYQTTMFRITLARFGAISIDFGFSIGDRGGNEPSASISHIRALEALMGPHMGNLRYVWKQAPQETKAGQFVRPEAVNFVHVYSTLLDWIKRARQELDDQAEAFEFFNNHFNFDEHIDTGRQSAVRVEKFKTSLEKLRGRLADISRDKPYEVMEKSFGEDVMTYVPDLQEVYDAYNELRAEFFNWQWFNATPEAEEDPLETALRADALTLFPTGRVFSKMMDISAEIFRRFGKFLAEFTKLPEVDVPFNKDIRSLFRFDRHYGWQSILEVNRIALRDADGNEHEPVTDEDFQAIFNHPDFIGFAVTSREARAALDDWRFANPPPTQKDLAGIRSHQNDRFYIEQNRAFIFLPDDPQFVVNQYNDTSRWAGNLVAAILSHQNASKSLMGEIEIALDAYENGIEQDFRMLRGKIQIFQRDALQTLDLVRNFALTKYVDHSELLRALVKTSRIEFLASILEGTCGDLDRLYGYLGDLLAAQVTYS